MQRERRRKGDYQGCNCTAVRARKADPWKSIRAATGRSVTGKVFPKTGNSFRLGEHTVNGRLPRRPVGPGGGAVRKPLPGLDPRAAVSGHGVVADRNELVAPTVAQCVE